MAASSNDSQTNQPRQPGNSGTRPTSPEETKDGYKPTGNRYFGALVLVATIIPLPFLAALITIIAYLSKRADQTPEVRPSIAGILLTSRNWLHRSRSYSRESRMTNLLSGRSARFTWGDPFSAAYSVTFFTSSLT